MKLTTRIEDLTTFGWFSKIGDHLALTVRHSTIEEQIPIHFGCPIINVVYSTKQEGKPFKPHDRQTIQEQLGNGV